MDLKRTLFSASDLAGCGWMRSYLPAKYTGGNFMGGFTMQYNFSEVDNIIFQRHHHIDFVNIVREFQVSGKGAFYDIDDDLWTIADSNPAKACYTTDVLSTTERIIENCSGVFTSTEYLKNKLTHLNPCVNVIPNLVEVPATNKEIHNKIRIGYAGSSSHVGDFDHKLIYALRKLHNKYKNKIEFIFFGYVPEDLKDIVHFVSGIEPQHYLESLNYLDFDISLIPLADTEFNKSKSNLKWLDSSICKACPVISDVFCYADAEDGVTGIKVRKDKWFDTLESLINDELLRKTIAQQSYDHVLEHYTWLNAKNKQTEVYASITKGET
jgi:O-antigen biosynthesis protein